MNPYFYFYGGFKQPIVYFRLKLLKIVSAANMFKTEFLHSFYSFLIVYNNIQRTGLCIFMTQEISFERFIPCHVLSRAVDKKTIFSDQEDCARFIFQMYALNIGKPAYNLYRRNMVEIADLLLDGKEIAENLINFKDTSLVDILSFSLAKDHVHFILTPNIENGIPKYMHKLNLSFAKYFNSRHKREGILFKKP